MTEKELVLQATDIWRSHGMSYEKSEYLEQRIKRQIDAAILKAVTASTEFTFAIGLVTHTFSDTNSLVELRGKSSDARDVYTILWGANNKSVKKNCLFNGIENASNIFINLFVPSGFNWLLK